MSGCKRSVIKRVLKPRPLNMEIASLPELQSLHIQPIRDESLLQEHLGKISVEFPAMEILSRVDQSSGTAPGDEVPYPLLDDPGFLCAYLDIVWGLRVYRSLVDGDDDPPQGIERSGPHPREDPDAVVGDRIEAVHVLGEEG